MEEFTNYEKSVAQQIEAQGVNGLQPVVIESLCNDKCDWINRSTGAINEPLLCASLIDKYKLSKTRAGAFQRDGQPITADELKKLLIDEIAPFFPEEATKRAHYTFDMLKGAIQTEAIKAGSNGVKDYIQHFLRADIAAFTSGSNIKTGFTRLDSMMGGFYPGLYAIGAISSLGKTTLIHQIADQMAANGNPVIFFSLEQSRLEMVSKSLSRLTAKRDMNTAITSLKIRKGGGGQTSIDAALEYGRTVGNNLEIIEGNFNCTFSFIADYTRQYIEAHNTRPVVIIDYLQIMQPDRDNLRAELRQSIDINVSELKRLTRELNIAVVVISSVNRQNYLTPMDFESFKESGGIEYTSDVVWGLQLACMSEKEFIESKKETLVSRRERVKAAKAETPRKVDLICLKTRYGSPDMTIHFDYYPRYDYFVETGAEGTDAETGYKVENEKRIVFSKTV